MDLSDYQRRVSKTDERKNMLISLAGLVSEVGSIASAYKNRRLLTRHIPTFNRELAEELGDTLWYLASVANAAGLSLNDIVRENLKKAHWFSDSGEAIKFDKRYPPDEQFPRRFEVTFTEKKLNSNVLVRISTHDVIVGDHLTDNSHDLDGYRYHDVFHLAYAAVLGWSPVVRALLKRKRKSKPRVDEIEDGARALAVEEALSIFIFNHAKQQNFF